MDRNMEQRRCATCGHGDGNHLDDGCHRDASRCPCKRFVDSGFTMAAFQEYERVYSEVVALRAELAAVKEALDGMRGERDDEREIAQGWEKKAEELEEERDAAREEAARLRPALQLALESMSETPMGHGFELDARRLAAVDAARAALSAGGSAKDEPHA